MHSNLCINLGRNFHFFFWPQVSTYFSSNFVGTAISSKNISLIFAIIIYSIQHEVGCWNKFKLTTVSPICAYWYNRISSSDTALGVNTPRSVNSKVIKLAGVKSQGGFSTLTFSGNVIIIIEEPVASAAAMHRSKHYKRIAVKWNKSCATLMKSWKSCPRVPAPAS